MHSGIYLEASKVLSLSSLCFDSQPVGPLIDRPLQEKSPRERLMNSKTRR